MMTPTHFEQANRQYGPPPSLTEGQCRTISAHVCEAANGSVDGAFMVVTAWKPNERELAALNAGQPVFLTCLGGLPPHFITTSFQEATNPA